MPRFIDSVANPQVPPPYRFPGVNTHAILFDVEMSLVQQYCDRYFNIGDAVERGFVYRPVPWFPYAMILVLEYPAMIPESSQVASGDLPPMKDRGYAGQNEFLISFPVMRHGTRRGNFLSDMAIEWATPIVIVNNSTSAISGREILGMDKIYGLVEVAGQSVLAGFMSEICLPASWTTLSDSTQNMMKFVSIETGPPAPSLGRSANYKSAATLLGNRPAAQALAALSTVLNGLDTMTGGLMPNPMQIVMLKQFRDASDPTKAAYQALIGARCAYSDLGEYEFYNELDVQVRFRVDARFNDLWTPILGVRPPDIVDGTSSWVTVPAAMAFSLKATIQTDNVRELHNFIHPQDRETSLDRGTLAPWLKPLAGFWNVS